jgi:hypothetical protein
MSESEGQVQGDSYGGHSNAPGFTFHNVERGTYVANECVDYSLTHTSCTYGEGAKELSSADAGNGPGVGPGKDSLVEFAVNISITDSCGYFSKEIYPRIGPECFSAPFVEAPLSAFSASMSATKCLDGSSSVQANLSLGVPGCDLVSASIGTQLSLKVLGVQVGLSATPGPGLDRLIGTLDEQMSRTYGALDYSIQRAVMWSHY